MDGCLSRGRMSAGMLRGSTLCSWMAPGGASVPFSPIPQPAQSTAPMPLENQVSPNSPISPRRSATQGSRPFHHRVWSGLSGKERRWVSWKQSARAIVFSSCQSSFDVQRGYMRQSSTHFSQCRASWFGHLHSSCLGIPLL
jgi:hypothetical protein